MEPTRHFPSRDRLSVLTAVIVLAYALMRLLDLPVRSVDLTLFGSALGMDIGAPQLLLLIATALASAGADTLMRSHPRLVHEPGAGTLAHWILPGAAALALGVMLARLTSQAVWWLGLAVSALALVIILVAEYIVVDPGDPAREAAALALTGLAHALALVLFTLLYSVSLRAALSATTCGLAAALLAWRLLRLDDAPAGRAWLHAAAVGLICAEALWALNYWRLGAPSAGALLLAVFYISVGAAQHQLAGRLNRRVWLEYGLTGLAALALVLGFGLN